MRVLGKCKQEYVWTIFVSKWKKDGQVGGWVGRKKEEKVKGRQATSGLLCFP